jgi:DNA-binding MarR family transcriptional regulator
MAATNGIEFTTTLMWLHREMRAMLGGVAREVGLTAQQVELLCVLQARTPALGELAEMFGCDKTNITGMADRLSRRGLVDRTTDPADRRVTRLALTDDGARFATELKDQVAVRVEARWRTLPAADRATIIGLKSTSDG